MLQVSRVFCITAKMRADVADGSRTGVGRRNRDFRFTLKAEIKRTLGNVRKVPGAEVSAHGSSRVCVVTISRATKRTRSIDSEEVHMVRRWLGPRCVWNTSWEYL